MDEDRKFPWSIVLGSLAGIILGVIIVIFLVFVVGQQLDQSGVSL